MIVSNTIARLLLKTLSLRKGRVIAIALWPFIFVWPAHHAVNQRLIRHEKKHLEQWKRYWIVGFVPVYLWQCFRKGYRNCPLEVEARRAEE